MITNVNDIVDAISAKERDDRVDEEYRSIVHALAAMPVTVDGVQCAFCGQRNRHLPVCLYQRAVDVKKIET